MNQAIQHYSCFISYSTKDEDFAKRIHADLQNNGVRCWFAPHDLPIGEKILDSIDAAIRVRDKVLLILSEHSIQSEWVEDEVTKGFEEERKRGHMVLFPVRLDDAVLGTAEAWAAKLARPAPPHGPERRRGHLDEAKAGVPGGAGASAFLEKADLLCST